MPPPNKVPADRVRQLLAKGLEPRVIAERLGVNRTSVFAIAAEVRKAAGVARFCNRCNAAKSTNAACSSCGCPEFRVQPAV